MTDSICHCKDNNCSKTHSWTVGEIMQGKRK